MMVDVDYTQQHQGEKEVSVDQGGLVGRGDEFHYANQEDPRRRV